MSKIDISLLNNNNNTIKVLNMKAKENTNTSIKQKIKQYLAPNAVKEISVKHKVSVKTVYRVLDGDVENPYILESLVERAEFAKQIKNRALSL